MGPVDIAFAAVIVGLLIANVQKEEIRRSVRVFGGAAISGPGDCHSKDGEQHKVLCYVRDTENVVALRRFFFLRVVLKGLFILFCVLSALYISLVFLHTVRIQDIQPVERSISSTTHPMVTIAGASPVEDARALEARKSIVVTRSQGGDVAVYELNHGDGGGRLVWIDGDGGGLTEIGVSTWFQFVGVFALLMGIATIAYATALQHSDD